MQDNVKEDENFIKIVQRNFYMDEILESLRTTQEAIQIYRKVLNLLSEAGFNSARGMRSDKEVKSQIPETDKSTKVVKTFEVEPPSSSVLGQNLNVDTNSLIVCRGTLHEV